MGWSPKPTRGKSDGQRHRPASGKAHVRKVFAIWGDMCKANIPAIANRAGLLVFVQRMTGIDDPEWITPEQAQVVTEALKSWRVRVLAKRGRK